MCKSIIFFFFFVFLLFPSQLKASKLDSLLSVLVSMKDQNSLDDLDKKSIICNSIAVWYQDFDEDNNARSYFLQSIFFAKKRIIDSNGWDDPQSNYDMAYLFQNLAIFESTCYNFDKAKECLTKSEAYYEKLKKMIPKEDYEGVVIGFYTAFITWAFHSENFTVGIEYIKKVEKIVSGSYWPIKKAISNYRIHGEFLSALGETKQAEIYFLKALALLDKQEDKTGLEEHNTIHALITLNYYSKKYQNIVDLLLNREHYGTVEQIQNRLDKNEDFKDEYHYLKNLSILSYAYVKIYDSTKNIKYMEEAYKYLKLVFSLAEENILKNNAEKLKSVLINPKNKISGILKMVLTLFEHDRIDNKTVFEMLRIVDVYHSTRLHLERVSYTVNQAFWTKQKVLKNELNFVNEKLAQMSIDSSDNNSVDSLRNIAFELSIQLQEIGESTKKEKVLDEYRVGQNGFDSLLIQYVKKTNKNILTYFYEEGSDSLFTIGINADTSFIVASLVSVDFISQIKELFQLNSRLLYTSQEINRQKELNQIFYKLCFKPVKHFLNSTDLLIYPIDEMSYISFDALMSEEETYLINDYSIHYTTSLFSVVSPNEKEKISDRFVSFYPSNYGTDSLAFLFNAQKEVDEIKQVLNGEIYSAKKATKTKFIDLAKASKILHLASHSILNFDHPYESYIIFDATIDSNDHKLYAYEIFSQTLNADLVVLSSCNTAQGDIIDGTGVVSLSNAFYFAGVPATISSLWSAQDKSSSNIMIDFYQNLNQGQTKSASLRTAKLNYLATADKTKSQPFFWANYVIYGNDEALFEKTQNSKLGYYIIGGVLGLIGLLFGWRYFKSPSKS